ncbi:MAG: MoaD/ThiS family protein [Mycobacterium sp.]|nr:MoaD/ThiS family protein [Mycobacterium sp.]
MTDVTPAMTITVRYFAAARDAAGADSSVLHLKNGATIDDAIRELCGQSDKMILVLQKCSFLSDGVAVRDRGTVLRPHQTLDVLPPFAGG